tara:strand:+ start:12 stop:806 length:795 start_codon:yes stop_codon:yes gene_type:complete
MEKPPCPEGLLSSCWAEATTQLWTDQDKETQTSYKKFFTTRTDLETYDGIQLELLHSFRLYRLVAKKRKGSVSHEDASKKQAPDESSALFREHEALKEAKAAVDAELVQLKKDLDERPLLTAAQADSIVSFVKQRATSTTEELAEVKKKLALETRHHTAVWAVLKSNCADDPKRFDEFKNRLDHELGRTKAPPPVVQPSQPPKRLSFPREHDDVFFKSGDQKLKGKILRVLQNRSYRVAPNDADAGGPVNVPIAELFDAQGAPF